MWTRRTRTNGTGGSSKPDRARMLISSQFRSRARLGPGRVSIRACERHLPGVVVSVGRRARTHDHPSGFLRGMCSARFSGRNERVGYPGAARASRRPETLAQTRSTVSEEVDAVGYLPRAKFFERTRQNISSSDPKARPEQDRRVRRRSRSCSRSRVRQLHRRTFGGFVFFSRELASPTHLSVPTAVFVSDTVPARPSLFHRPPNSPPCVVIASEELAAPWKPEVTLGRAWSPHRPIVDFLEALS